MRMNNLSKHSRWIFLFTLILAAILLFLALRGVDWKELYYIIQSARWEYLAIAFLLASANYIMRALRWRVLLSAERWMSVLDVFCAMMAGYMGNSFLPARAGEIVRSVALGRRAKISSSFVLATAITERILDACVLVLIGSASLTMLLGTSHALLNAGRGMAIISAAGLAGIFILPMLERPTQWALGHLPLPSAWKDKLSSLLQQFLLGMRSLRHTGRALSFFAFTAVIWLGDAFVTITVAHSLALSFSVPQALLLNVALGLSSAIPSTPGYIGVFQFVAVSTLVPLGFNQNQALAYIFVAQAMGYIITVCWGLFGLWRLKIFGLLAESAK